MKKYILLFYGGVPKKEERDAHMKEWGVWMGALAQKKILIGGEPFGMPGRVVKGAKNTVSDYKGNLGGYLLVNAKSMPEAEKIACQAPHQQNGGTTEVFECTKM